MGKKLSYERYYWFHGQVKAGQYPNARSLAGKFEISQKQAQREIEFMRDRLDAPLYYNTARKGYEYEDDGYELPPVWFKEDELLSLCLALRLAATLPDHAFKDALYGLLEKILAFRFINDSPSLDEIKEKVSVKNVEYYRVDEATFHQVVDALFKDEFLKITYFTPHQHETTERIIQPLHLLCYMGNWHLIALCTWRNEIRDFALSRIREVEAVAGPAPAKRRKTRIKEFIDRNFGVMTGEESREVCLKFNPGVAEWISEQIWHSGQVLKRNADGSICLKFPVADFREVRREILRYGGDVEVLSPAELRDEIRKEIKRMREVYE